MATEIGNDTYLAHSGQDIDDAIDAVATKIGKTDAYKGTEITENTDLDTLTNIGTYYCQTSTVAATLSNCPVSGSGFILQIFSTGNRFEILYPVTATPDKIYVRCFTGGSTSGTWKDWYVFSGAVYTPPEST